MLVVYGRFLFHVLFVYFYFLIGLSGVVSCRRDVVVVIMFRLGGRYLDNAGVNKICKWIAYTMPLGAFLFYFPFLFVSVFFFLTRCVFMPD